MKELKRYCPKEVVVTIDLSRYTVAQIRQLYREGAISKQELNDEFDARLEGSQERVACNKDRKAVAP